MPEFPNLPIAAGPLVPRISYNDIIFALNNRRLLVLPDATAALTIYNSAADATSATVEIDTAANEIHLIVIGGASASNTTLDLTAAANDTITELVAAINALGFSWEAEEMSGALTAHADNKSETLLSLGPANVLGAARITWFTNYVPNGMMSEILIGNIGADNPPTLYRAGIEEVLLPGQTGYFGESYLEEPRLIDWRWMTNIGRALIQAGLAPPHTDWGDPAAALPADLIVPCLPNIKLWNDMKLVLEACKWVHVWNTGAAWTMGGVNLTKDINGEATWAAARGAAFAGLAAGGGPGANRVGRLGSGNNGFDCEVNTEEYATIEWTSKYDYDALVPLPTVSDCWIAINNADTDGFVPTYHSAAHFDLYLTGTKFNSVPLTFPGPRVGGATQFSWWHCDDLGDATYDLDGATPNTLKIQYIGTMTDDPGVGEWPEPPGAANQSWGDFFSPTTVYIFMEFAWP